MSNKEDKKVKGVVHEEDEDKRRAHEEEGNDTFDVKVHPLKCISSWGENTERHEEIGS